MADTQPDEESARQEPRARPLSLPSQLIIAVAVAAVGVAVAIHVAMAYLNISPPNTVTKEHGDAVDDYIYPEFERNWKLFAPNPIQQNVAVQARAEIITPGGGVSTTRWTDLSAQDGKAILHNPLPSHTQQNELRRAWEFYVLSHDENGVANGLRGQLSEQYVRRIVMLRFGAEQEGGTVRRVQVRSATTPVGAPSWSDEKIDTSPLYRELPWWKVTDADLPKGERS